MADRYIVTQSELKGLADAIRTKSGTTDNMTFPDGMISTIESMSIGVEQIFSPTDTVEFKDYIKKEATRVATEVRKVLKDDSIVSLCMSDSHFSHHNSSTATTATSGNHASRAMKALTYMLPIDFIAHTGDVGYENKPGNIEDLKVSADELLEFLKEVSNDEIPILVAIGNHDAGDYILHNTYRENQGKIKATSGYTVAQKIEAVEASNNAVTEMINRYPDVVKEFSSYKVTLDSKEYTVYTVPEPTLDVFYQRMSSYLFSNYIAISGLKDTYGVFDGTKWKANFKTLEEANEYATKNGYEKVTVDRNVYGPSNSLENNKGYMYRDFNKGRIRVFVLNTLESSLTYKGTDLVTKEQTNWLISAIDELNTKEDSGDWGFLILSHYPLDYSYTKEQLGNIIYTYVTGQGNYATFKKKANADDNAKFVGQFHGHIHNYLCDKLHFGKINSYGTDTPSTSTYKAYRLAIPNAEFQRENTYCNKTNNSGLLWGIRFFEGEVSDRGASAQYLKTSNTAKDTSFVVNVINPSDKRVYSFTYGAGPSDYRTFGYNYTAVEYDVSVTLTNLEFEKDVPTTIYENLEFKNTLKASGGYSLAHANVVVKMGGVVQENAYTYDADSDTGEIFIGNVTGELEIIASTNVASYYTIARSLSNTSSDMEETLKVYPDEAGKILNYKERITFKDVRYQYAGDGFNVTMGGEPIDSDYITIVHDVIGETSAKSTPGYYEINIPEVTGNIEIRAHAVGLPNFTNLVPTSTDYDGVTIYNKGLGYQDGVRYDSADALKSEAGITSTGLINVNKWLKTNYTIRIAGEGIQNSYDWKTKLTWYNSDRTYSGIGYGYNNITDGNAKGNYYPWADPVTYEDGENVAAKIRFYNSANNGWGKPYFRVCIPGSGKNLIVTINEPITYGGWIEGAYTPSEYTVTYNLDGVESSTTSTKVDKDASFQTTISVGDDSQEIKSVKVTMSGIDITSKVYSKGVITIDKVTGDIVITAKGGLIGDYENLLPTALDTDGVTIYGDGKGYVDGKRISTSTGLEGTANTAGFRLTGYIPLSCASGPVTVYVIGMDVLDTGNVAVVYGYSGLSTSTGTEQHTLQDKDGISTHKPEYVDSSGRKYFKFEFTNTKTRYVRFSCVMYDGVIITTDRPSVLDQI